MLLRETYRRASRAAARLAVGGVCGCAVAACASAEKVGYTPPPFSDYQPILDRMPFGALPANFGQAAAAAAAPTDAQVQAEQQKLAKQINMSCINVTPDGTTAIGFTDLEAKPPVNYYLLVGATAGGWTVVKADYDEEWAQVEKEGVTITLKLGKGLIDAPPTHQQPAAVAQTPAAPTATTLSPEPADTMQVSRPGMVRRPSQTGLPPMPTISAIQLANLAEARAEMAKIKAEGGDVRSYMDRLRERRKAESEKIAATEKAAREELQVLARKATEEELRKKERELNLKLLEQGANPVSDIELTPEEEQALVNKGVLAQ